ncbi:MAG: zinc ribbon domain-containing protein [Eggerthellaceae bacterium]|nr:zinc ribbon domain-containing protein [Eggerthellaceae bacterium]
MCFRPSTLTVTKKCPQCGHENDTQEKTCTECGAELPDNVLDLLDASVPAAPPAPGAPGAPAAPGAPVAPGAPKPPTAS